jgi:hypothetical protein
VYLVYKELMSNWGFIIMLALVTNAGLCALRGAVHDFQGGPLPEVKLQTSNFRLWLDEGNPVCKGVLVLVPGRHGDGRGMVEDGAWQELARTLGLALLGCQFSDGEPFPYQNDEGGVVSASINAALVHFSTAAGRSELAQAPLAFWGHSAGSNVAANYVKAFPDRVLAVASSKGTSAARGVTKQNVEVPMLFAIGKKDKAEWVEESVRCIQAGREEKAVWTLALQPNEGHELGNSLAVCRLYLSFVVPARLKGTQPTGDGKVKLASLDPKDGWLGDPETMEVGSYADYMGKKKEAIWIPDEPSARAWQAYLR